MVKCSLPFCNGEMVKYSLPFFDSEMVNFSFPFFDGKMVNCEMVLTQLLEIISCSKPFIVSNQFIKI